MKTQLTWKVTDLRDGKSYIGSDAIGKRFGYVPAWANAICRKNPKEINGVPVMVEKIHDTRRLASVRCVETGEYYPSMTAAAKALGVTHSSIWFAVKRGGKSRGYHWRRA